MHARVIVRKISITLIRVNIHLKVIECTYQQQEQLGLEEHTETSWLLKTKKDCSQNIY